MAKCLNVRDLRPLPSWEPLQFLGVESAQEWTSRIAAPSAMGKVFLVLGDDLHAVDQTVVSSVFLLSEKGRRLLPITAKLNVADADTFFAYDLTPPVAREVLPALHAGACVVVGLPRADLEQALALLGVTADSELLGGVLRVEATQTGRACARRLKGSVMALPRPPRF